MRQISKELYDVLKDENRIEKVMIEGKEYERTGNFLFIESSDDADEDKLKEYNKENKTELYFYLIRAEENLVETKDPETITESKDETKEDKSKAKTHKGKTKKEDEGHGA